jgi:glycosyltransferase involved in cell wall biosynthesis
MLSLPEAPTLKILNLEQPVPKDGRTLLLNMGLQAAQGRYVGFLDYDDLLYPEAYRTIVPRLRATDAAIAFAAVRVVRAEVHSQFIRVATEVKDPFGPGERLVDLFRGNFCPIHSFLLDRHRIDPEDLVFDPALTWEEDYDLLLRICAKYPSDFALIKTKVGEYYYKTDGSNSGAAEAIQNAAQRGAYARVSAMIEARRRTTVVSPEVQSQHGVAPPEAGMTIRRFIDRVSGS